MDLHSLPSGWRPESAVRNNGPNELALERWKLRELAEGWPMYRDSCEWENFASIFAPDAYLYTTWTGKISWKDFFQMSKDGMDKGAFIMHRCSGATTDINTDATRAMTKMKATITQRFELEGCEVDAEADCRFAYFWEKGTDEVTDIPRGEWRARFVRHWYEKDWLRPVKGASVATTEISYRPNKIPHLDEAKLATYPNGYRYLSYCQEATIPGLKVLMDLPGHRRDADNLNGKAHDALYLKCKTWLEGGKIDF